DEIDVVAVLPGNVAHVIDVLAEIAAEIDLRERNHQAVRLDHDGARLEAVAADRADAQHRPARSVEQPHAGRSGIGGFALLPLVVAVQILPVRHVAGWVEARVLDGGVDGRLGVADIELRFAGVGAGRARTDLIGFEWRWPRWTLVAASANQRKAGENYTHVVSSR